jgi:hypothetical protein
VHSIKSSLSLGLHDNARFLAERLAAANPSEVRAALHDPPCEVLSRAAADPGAHLCVWLCVRAAPQVSTSHLLPPLQPGISGSAAPQG